MNTDLGFLLVRLIVGLAIAAHGAQKLFGLFGGHGIKGTAGFMESLGFRPGTLFAVASGASETLGGLLIILGLGGPLGSLLVIATMIVAIFSVHLKNGFWAANTGYELNSLYIAASIAIAFAPLSALSLDGVLGLTLLHQPTVIWSGLGLGLLGGLANLALRRAVPSVVQAAG
ncbi:MAG: DoxX family protein [Candidatus Baltobacteraceae bacterium]